EKKRSIVADARCHCLTQKKEDQLTQSSAIVCSSTRHISVRCQHLRKCNICKQWLAADEIKALKNNGKIIIPIEIKRNLVVDPLINDKEQDKFIITWPSQAYFPTMELLRRSILGTAVKKYNDELDAAITMCKLQEWNSDDDSVRNGVDNYNIGLCLCHESRRIQALLVYALALQKASSKKRQRVFSEAYQEEKKRREEYEKRQNQEIIKKISPKYIPPLFDPSKRTDTQNVPLLGVLVPQNNGINLAQHHAMVKKTVATALYTLSIYLFGITTTMLILDNNQYPISRSDLSSCEIDDSWTARSIDIILYWIEHVLMEDEKSCQFKGM
ncbi:27888_t:CDS:2, partial [Racocetra persica]